MKALLRLLFQAILVCRFSADKLETNYGSSQSPSCKDMKKVTLFQPLTYDYTLNTQDWQIWSEFPLSMTVTIPQAQELWIKYQIVNWSQKACWFSTILKVDGKQHPKFRIIDGINSYHSHIAFGSILLEKGVHFIAVYYSSNCSWPVVRADPYYYSYIQVKYCLEINEKC